MADSSLGRLASIALGVVIASVLTAEAGRGCTTFCLRDQGRIVVGSNMDWMVSEAYLLVNKRGVARSAMVDERPAHWTSRYGSVSFNQYGRDLPLGGMNEAGLVIENLWLVGTRYPDADARPALNVLSWIQYQLDMSATVAEVIDSNGHLRIASAVPLHFFVADRGGRVATIEFLGGRTVHHTADTLPVAALTNTTYRELLRAFERHQGRNDTSSIGRFTIAARRVADYSASDSEPVDYAFETLRQTRQSNTQWSEVYEIDRLKLHYQTRSDPRTRTLDLSGLDFSCSSPVLGIDIHADVEGDTRPYLTPFSAQQNLALIRSAYEKTPFLADRSDVDHQQVARHAEEARCVVPR